MDRKLKRRILFLILILSFISYYFTSQPVLKIQEAGIPQYQLKPDALGEAYISLFISMLITMSCLLGLMIDDISQEVKPEHNLKLQQNTNS